ncbi:hypothetical protein GCM10009839_01930 [Catenulispora yoronensis]|uniref:OmpR/PhoB-type domain-containing protein n=1 Tax=Catenulispora yoronensis TaxID=450799 RepID=A0ABP5F1S7_9ACTN
MAMTEFRVLGAIETMVAGRAVQVGSARQRAVLAVLLAEANRVVTVDQVIDRVWGQGPVPENPRPTVSTYISLLRRALNTTSGVHIVRHPSGYKMVLDERCVDVHRFRELLTAARAQSSDSQAADLLQAGLDLWRGEPYTGMETPWSNAARQNLLLQRYSARLDLTDLYLRLGRHTALVGELTDQAEKNALDERIAGQLMLALYRCGRKADALARYQQTRSRLAAELGSDPGPSLRDLQARILSDDGDLAVAIPEPAAAGPGHRARKQCVNSRFHPGCSWVARLNQPGSHLS